MPIALDSEKLCTTGGSNVIPRSRVGLRAAPARQIFRLFASRQAQRPLHRGRKIHFEAAMAAFAKSWRRE